MTLHINGGAQPNQPYAQVLIPAVVAGDDLFAVPDEIQFAHCTVDVFELDTLIVSDISTEEEVAVFAPGTWVEATAYDANHYPNHTHYEGVLMSARAPQQTIKWLANADVSGTWQRGYFDSPWGFAETVARLLTASGQHEHDRLDDKTSVEFVGIYNGHVFTLYDFKANRRLQIGGKAGLDVDGLQLELARALASVQPMPFDAHERWAGRKTRYGWGPELERKELS